MPPWGGYPAPARQGLSRAAIIAIVGAGVIVLVALALPFILARPATSHSATYVPPLTFSPVVPTEPTPTTVPPPLPTPELVGDGLTLSGRGWLWSGPPLVLGKAQGVVIHVQNQYGRSNYLNIEVQAPALPGTESEFNMTLEFRAPSNQPLTVGTYSDATRAPFAQVGPGIDISGNGAGCNQEIGSFTVKSIAQLGQSFNAFDIKFQDSCDHSPLLIGEVRYG